MKKVYCKNCKWYWALKQTHRGGNFFHTNYFCDPCSTIKYSTGFFVVAETYDIGKLFDCSKQNENNNCKYYKRKWWKFWEQ